MQPEETVRTDRRMARLLTLPEVSDELRARVGGKAANLARMMASGLHVPQGMVVPVDFYESFVQANSIHSEIEKILSGVNVDDDESLEAASKKVKDLFRSPRLDWSMSKDIVTILDRIDPRAVWAVRSSAVAEDLPEASFAGQQDSFLCVRKEQVPENVRRCWASYWNARAMKYRHDSGIDHFAGGVAVIVQKMADARSSGVMFTSDPIGGRKDRLVIESCWGLGESAVSGTVTPDRFVCEKKDCSVIQKMVEDKTSGLFLRDGAKVLEDLGPQRSGEPSLSDDEIRQLAKIGRRIEELFGSPQDVEWALERDRIYILQSRPITTLDVEQKTLWTRAYGDEYWADVTSPLFYSLLGEYLTEYVNREGSRIMGYKELTDKELLKVHKGHVYFNSAVLESVFTYNPKFSRTKELLNYFPKKDQARIAAAPTKVLKRLLAEVRIAILDHDGMITRTDKAYRKWAAGFMEKMRAFDSLDLMRLSDQELEQEFRRMEHAYLKHYRLIRYGMVTHSIGMNLILKRWLNDWLGDRSGAVYARLISGLPDNKTIQTNIAIAKLAEAAKGDAAVLMRLRGKTSSEFIKALGTDPGMKGFSVEFQRFIDAYGHRSHTREIFFPRWADDPTLVVDMLKALASSNTQDLEALERRNAEERVAAEKEVLVKIRRLKYGFVKKPVFRMIMRYAQTYLTFRENQRFYLDHQIARQRKLFMEYGRRFVERGIISDQSDVFFLSKEEVFKTPANPAPGIRKLVGGRRKEFDAYRDELPPKFLLGRTEFDDTVSQEGGGMRITGTSSSPGTASGRVRVVLSIDKLGEVKEGEILVTSNTDPGWTAIFSKISGLVTETGGILSHGAVVSREYGIPAVTAVRGATKLLKTGQKVTVDGNEGIVQLMGE